MVEKIFDILTNLVAIVGLVWLWVEMSKPMVLEAFPWLLPIFIALMAIFLSIPVGKMWKKPKQ